MNFSKLPAKGMREGFVSLLTDKVAAVLFSGERGGSEKKRRIPVGRKKQEPAVFPHFFVSYDYVLRLKARKVIRKEREGAGRKSEDSKKQGGGPTAQGGGKGKQSNELVPSLLGQGNST